MMFLIYRVIDIYTYTTLVYLGNGQATYYNYLGTILIQYTVERMHYHPY